MKLCGLSIHFILFFPLSGPKELLLKGNKHKGMPRFSLSQIILIDYVEGSTYEIRIYPKKVLGTNVLPTVSICQLLYIFEQLQKAVFLHFALSYQMFAKLKNKKT